MDLDQQISRQRVKHIVSSYQLDSGDEATFHSHLEELLRIYPHPLIELALVESLVESWLSFPPQRGMEFFNQVLAKLAQWENHEIVSSITPEQFQEITGLDPKPIFGSSGHPVLAQL